MFLTLLVPLDPEIQPSLAGFCGHLPEIQARRHNLCGVGWL